MKRKILLILLLLFILLAGTSCDRAKIVSGDDIISLVPPKTEDGWKTGTPESAGMRSDVLVTMTGMINKTKHHLIHSLLIVRNTTLVYEYYWPGYDVPLSGSLSLVEKDFSREALHYQASVSKSVTSALFGIAVDHGLIAGVTQSLFSFFPDYSALKNSSNERITLFDMLSMSSGFTWSEFEYGFDDPRDSHYRMFDAVDPLSYLLGRDVVTEPGTLFHYNSRDTNLLGEIIRRAAGVRYLEEFAVEKLFGPLGIDQLHWNRLPRMERVTFASGGLFLRPRDMAKFGLLYLNDGVWNGKQLISSSWVAESQRLAITVLYGKTYGYGYQWWLCRFQSGAGETDCFYALGWGGQYILVIPGYSLVIVHTAGGYNDVRPVSITRLVEDYILKSID